MPRSSALSGRNSDHLARRPETVSKATRCLRLRRHSHSTSHSVQGGRRSREREIERPVARSNRSLSSSNRAAAVRPPYDARQRGCMKCRPALFPTSKHGLRGERRRDIARLARLRGELLWNPVLTGVEQVLTESPQPSAVAIDLEVRPVVGNRRTVEGKTGRRHAVRMQRLALSMPVDCTVDQVADSPTARLTHAW